jgi:glycosyltransferase involved in cell wall biosynthesis
MMLPVAWAARPCFYTERKNTWAGRPCQCLPSPLRITFVLPQADLSGGARVVAIYAQKLADRGHRVTVVSRPPRAPTVREKLRSKLTGKAPPSAARKTPSHLDHLQDVEHRQIDRRRPIAAADLPDADVVVATWWETAEWVADLPQEKGKPVYFLQHYEVYADQPADRVDATWRLPMPKIAVARWLADLAREKFGESNVTIVPNAVDLTQFHAPPRGKRPVPTIGVMYSHVGFKGCDIALDAFNRARRTVPGLKLVAFGHRGPTPDLPLPPGTAFTLQPAQDAMRQIYAAADAWLFASRHEGFGLPILEAMACRTPVIATPAGAAPELVSQRGGILTKPEDPADMARAIERIAGMKESEWRALSDAAYDTATRYTWDDAADLFERALEQAVRGGQPA